MARDRIVVGARLWKRGARLFQQGFSITIDKAIDTGRTMEILEADLKTTVVYTWGVLGPVNVGGAQRTTDYVIIWNIQNIELIYSRESSLLKCLWIIIIVYLWPLRPLFKLYHDLCFINFVFYV